MYINDVRLTGEMTGKRFNEKTFFDSQNARRNLDAVVSSVIFEGWNRSQVQRFMSEVGASVRSYNPGNVIVEKGEVADGMYLILKGAVELPDLGEKLVAPSSFGEAAVLPYKPDKERNATVIAERSSPEGVGFVTDLAYLPGVMIMAMKSSDSPLLTGFYGGLIKEVHQRMANMNVVTAGLREKNADLTRRLDQYAKEER